MPETFDLSKTDEEYSYDGALGAVYSRSGTDFIVWTPYALGVRVRLYHTCTDSSSYHEQEMERGARGEWSCRIDGDLDGVYYTYVICSESGEAETIDIYARSAGANGRRGMIFSPESVDTEGWEQQRPVPLRTPADAVIYELHVRDFSCDESGGFSHRGKFTAFCEEGVTNRFGGTIGLSYIASLGVTHIHLLPVFDFASVDEQAPTFNWGYDPLNYNVPEGSYSSDPYDGHIRVRELRQLVSAIHGKGMGVIFDVVYNHTYETESSPFGRTFPHYYYRHTEDGEYSNGSGCGNEFASERYMARRYIIDSLCYIARQYKADGFRFDLMGLLDIETLNIAAAELKKINPDILLYGEGWTGGLSPLDDSLRALKHHAARLHGFAMFSDDLRDGVKGSVFDDKDCGYINGVTDKDRTELIKSVLSGGVYHPGCSRAKEQCWADSPLCSVNYVESHDNLTFYDKLRLSMPKAGEKRLMQAEKMGAALVLLAQGIPFFQAGQEFLRSKDFTHDSYRSPDSVNSLKWDNVILFEELVSYYRGLIAIRRRFPEFRLGSGDEVRARVSFEDICEGAFAMHIGSLTLIADPLENAVGLDVGGDFEVYADSDRASDTPLYTGSGAAKVAPYSILLLRRIG